MGKILIVVAFIAAAILAVSVGNVQATRDIHKVTICHRTASHTNPYVRITVDEASRIQTFPDDYKFSGKQNSIYSQIGNAVPCELAYVVGAALQEVLDSEGL